MTMTIDAADKWLEARACSLRAVRHNRTWYVVLWSRRDAEKTGVGRTFEEALRAAMNLWS